MKICIIYEEKMTKEDKVWKKVERANTVGNTKGEAKFVKNPSIPYNKFNL